MAVFDMEDRGSGLKSQILENLTTFLSTKLAECGMQVVPQWQIKERRREMQAESYKACYDEA